MLIDEGNNKLVKLGVLFYLCSILGYLYELILSLIFDGKLLSHGILFGPWLPIYGTGALLITLLNKYRKKPLLIFMISFFITGMLEYICGYLLLHFLNMRLWDYRGWFLNIDGFVCFISAFCFGIGGLLIIYYLMPLINKMLKKVNIKLIKIILTILSIVFLIDILFAIFK